MKELLRQKDHGNNQVNKAATSPFFVLKDASHILIFSLSLSHTHTRMHAHMHTVIQMLPHTSLNGHGNLMIFLGDFISLTLLIFLIANHNQIHLGILHICGQLGQNLRLSFQKIFLLQQKSILKIRFQPYDKYCMVLDLHISFSSTVLAHVRKYLYFSGFKVLKYSRCILLP